MKNAMNMAARMEKTGQFDERGLEGKAIQLFFVFTIFIGPKNNCNISLRERIV